MMVMSDGTVPMSDSINAPEVLTVDEVAIYLRLPKETIIRQAMQGVLPGRQIEDTWRFLKAAIDDWLRSHDSRTLLLQQAGALADDESLSTLRTTIYAARQRPEVAPEHTS
jgi:excisionase family DNA binding protein